MTVTLEDRIAAAEECFGDAKQVWLNLIRDLQRENEALRHANAVLEARLDERRHIRPADGLPDPARRRQARKCLREGCENAFVGPPQRLYCDDCQGIRRREVLQQNLERAR